MIGRSNDDREWQGGSWALSELNIGASWMGGCGDMISALHCLLGNRNWWRSANEGDGGDRRWLGYRMTGGIMSNIWAQYWSKMDGWLRRYDISKWVQLCIVYLGIGIGEELQMKGKAATGHDWMQWWWYRMTGGIMSNSWAQMWSKMDGWLRRCDISKWVSAALHCLLGNSDIGHSI